MSLCILQGNLLHLITTWLFSILWRTELIQNVFKPERKQYCCLFGFQHLLIHPYFFLLWEEWWWGVWRWKNVPQKLNQEEAPVISGVPRFLWKEAQLKELGHHFILNTKHGTCWCSLSPLMEPREHGLHGSLRPCCWILGPDDLSLKTRLPQNHAKH